MPFDDTYSIHARLNEYYDVPDHWVCAECGRGITDSDNAVWTDHGYVCRDCVEEGMYE